MALPLALTGFLLVNAAWLHYLATIPREKVPRRPTAHLLAMMLGAAIAIGALALGASSGSLWPALAPTVLAALLAALFVYLLQMAPLPDGAITAAVGQRLPLIEARGDDGAIHRSTDWQGGRVLFKFYRGSW